MARVLVRKGASCALIPEFQGEEPMVEFVVVVLLLGLAAVLIHTPWRRRFLSDRIFAAYRKMVPAMSQTEREALDAGTVWWEGELFGGRPDWNKLLAYPAPRLSAEEQAFLDGPTETLCAMLDDWKISHELLDLPPEAWQYIRDNGFLGMIIPKRYGGLEFSALAHSEVVMKLSSRCNAAAVTVMVPNSLGPAELLLHYGTDEQKQHYLPRLAKGIDIPCFALTGPEAGSDASAIPDTGIVCYGEFEGRGNVLGMRITWEKRYITLGPVATLLGLAFKLRDPDHLIGEEESLGITLALIPTATPGVNIGRRHFPLSAAFQNGPNSGTDVFVPLEWVIGGTEGIGQGWRMLMESLAAGRSISLPAQSVAAAKLAARTTGAYSRIRVQFNLPIGRFEGVEEALARIGGRTYLMDAARCMTAGAVDLGEKPAVPSAIVKYHLTESMRDVLNDAMDVHGGKGICLGPNNYLGRAYQLVPVAITVEGANILTRSLIIFGQGAIRCHPWVLKEMQAANDPDPEHGAAAFDIALWGHVRFFLANLGRSFFLGITGGRPTRVPGSVQTRRYFQQLNRFAAALALLSDMSMLVLGGELKRREKLSARLGDVLSQLYLSSAALKRFEDQGQPIADLPLLTWALYSAFFKIQVALDGVLANFPNRWLAGLLRILVFPKGLTLTAPTDAMGHAVAQLLLAPSAARDRLTAGIYIPETEEEIVGRLEAALEAVIEADAVKAAMKKDRQRRGQVDRQAPEPAYPADPTAGSAPPQVDRISDETEAVAIATLARAEALTRAVIDVDDFAPEDLRRQS
jgi:acyl-CoA dehydrogenase